MRKLLKIAGAAASLLLGWQAAVHAQPLITGNTSAFGCGPIYTSDYTLGKVIHSFIPTGAGPTPCPNPPSNNNGRGLAIGGEEVFYTELVDAPGHPPGFGPSAVIRVAPFNDGLGGADTRTLDNPRTGTGIQDLTFSNGELYILTGYETDPPIIYGMNLGNGQVRHGPITLTGSTSPVIPLPAGTDSDGFAVLPNGNFLVNNGDTSCIYNEYDALTGALVPDGTINVPGGPGVCTGVDTDGTFLYFLTDFNSITQTLPDGTMTGFSFFDSGDDHQIEDISLVHPVTIISDVGIGHIFLGLQNSDDINTNFDILAELLLNGTLVPGAQAITRCIVSPPFNPSQARDVTVNFPVFPSKLVQPGDVISFRFSTRIGTNPDDTKCIVGASHRSAQGLFLYYDSVGKNSNIPLTIDPSPETKYFLHSNGGLCEAQNATVRSLDINAPTSALPKCAASPGVDFLLPLGNPNAWQLFGTWSLAPQP